MALADAFATSDAHYKAQLIHHTFGHLEPEPRKKYLGAIVFANGDYTDGPVVIKSTFEIDAPGWYLDLHEFVDRQKIDLGHVYRFEGSYMRFKNGGFRFVGSTKKVL